MAEVRITLSPQQKNLLESLAKDMGFHGDWCFYLPEEQDTNLYGGYIPAMVFRDVQDYFPLNGPIYGDQPFVIGQELTEAKTRCRLLNEHIKLDEETVNDILESAGLVED